MASMLWAVIARRLQWQVERIGTDVALRVPAGDRLDRPLWPRVEDLLRARHSPEQIADILRRLHFHHPSFWASQP